MIYMGTVRLFTRGGFDYGMVCGIMGGEREIDIELVMTRRLVERRSLRLVAIAVLLGIVVVAASADVSEGGRPAAVPRGVQTIKVQEETRELRVTGYCNCGKCCGWRNKWFFFGEPVYSYGKMKGSPKKVGLTALGKVAAKGTIAADPSVFPFGTKMTIPGYGPGIVQDIGGSVKGTHIDIWFSSHKEAMAWGTRKVKVKVVRD